MKVWLLMLALVRIFVVSLFVIVCSGGRRVDADERAVAAGLGSRGAVVGLDEQGSVVAFRCRESGRLSKEDFRQVGGFARLKTLALSGGRVLGDEHLALLANLPVLERATLDGVQLTDDGLRHLAGWKNLRKLTFYNVTNRGRFTGAGLVHLADLPHLQEFACGGSSFDDDGLEACARLIHLTDLQIWHTPITDAGVAHLTQLTGLRNLRLLSQWKPRITDASLPRLAQIKSLETLTLGETRLSLAGLRRLGELPNLKMLELYQVDIAKAELDKLKSVLSKVQIEHSPIAEKYRELFQRNLAAAP